MATIQSGISAVTAGLGGYKKIVQGGGLYQSADEQVSSVRTNIRYNASVRFSGNDSQIPKLIAFLNRPIFNTGQKEGMLGEVLQNFVIHRNQCEWNNGGKASANSLNQQNTAYPSSYFDLLHRLGVEDDATKYVVMEMFRKAGFFSHPPQPKQDDEKASFDLSPEEMKTLYKQCQLNERALWALQQWQENRFAKISNSREIVPMFTGHSKIPEGLKEFVTEVNGYSADQTFYGREPLLEGMAKILTPQRGNIVLVGEPGSGKSSMVYGLEAAIRDGFYPKLRTRQIWKVSLGNMVAGTKYRGEFEAKAKALMAEVKKNRNVMLFLDEAQGMPKAGAAEGSISLGDQFKEFLTEPGVHVIAALTTDDYRKYFEKDTALLRRFNKLVVPSPEGKELEYIVSKKLRDDYCPENGVHFPKELVPETIALCHRYIQNFHEPAKSLKVAEQSLMEALYEGRETVALNDILKVVAREASIPLHYLENRNELVLNAETELHRRVIAQDEAVTKIATMARRYSFPLEERVAPLSVLLTGPSSVGKTELAKALQQLLSGNEADMVRIDMSKYSEPHSVSGLIGAPPGYVGFDQIEGALTGPVRKHPFRVVLLDELEKAHEKVYELLLPVLREGKITDTSGHVVDFKDCIFVMTSNAGSAAAEERRNQGLMGFPGLDTAEASEKAANDIQMQAIRTHFPPEFLTRLTEGMVVCHTLNPSHQRQILARDLTQKLQNYYQGPYKLQLVIPQAIEEEVLTYLFQKLQQSTAQQTNLHKGAGQSAATLKNYLETPLRDFMLQYQAEHLRPFPKNAEVVVSLNETQDKLLFSLNAPQVLSVCKGNPVSAKIEQPSAKAG